MALSDVTKGADTSSALTLSRCRLRPPALRPPPLQTGGRPNKAEALQQEAANTGLNLLLSLQLLRDSAYYQSHSVPPLQSGREIDNF